MPSPTREAPGVLLFAVEWAARDSNPENRPIKSRMLYQLS